MSSFKHDNVEIAYLDEGEGETVVLVHGSGAPDRDGSVGAAKVLRDLSEGLATRGIAVLRYDSRQLAHPEQVKAMLDRCFAELAVPVTAYGGRVDKIVGDAMMALFGAPFNGPKDADNALGAANQMMMALAKLNAGRVNEGKARLFVVLKRKHLSCCQGIKRGKLTRHRQCVLARRLVPFEGLDEQFDGDARVRRNHDGCSQQALTNPFVPAFGKAINARIRQV